MLQDAWLDAREKMLEFLYLHGDVAVMGVVVLLVAFFVWRWSEAR